ncbi:hypothetical protein Ccrd_009666 [Cynara cardunculus var. scolymus]|uniref:Uncharacterized protein n=1 Tax=Cynara cardunculus var. scolymus TaxID=59895 RepID=A0A118K7A3_CYNCS|nr:hypothetical protein Ccrd_009666 [Cynara cardunculus var. scolymus]
MARHCICHVTIIKEIDVPNPLLLEWWVINSDFSEWERKNSLDNEGSYYRDEAIMLHQSGLTQSREYALNEQMIEELTLDNSFGVILRENLVPVSHPGNLLTSFPHVNQGGTDNQGLESIVEAFVRSRNASNEILATKPIPSLSSAYHLMAEDERQRAISHNKRPTTEAAAFKAFTPGRRDGIAHRNHDQNPQHEVDHVDETNEALSPIGSPSIEYHTQTKRMESKTWILNKDDESIVATVVIVNKVETFRKKLRIGRAWKAGKHSTLQQDLRRKENKVQHHILHLRKVQPNYEVHWPAETGTSVNQPESGRVPPANAPRGDEVGPSNQPPQGGHGRSGVRAAWSDDDYFTY